MRSLLLLIVVLAACSSPPPHAAQPKPDPTKEAWYGETAAQLRSITADAETLLHRGAADEAAALVTKGQPLIHRLLSVTQPTLSAMEAVSDLDQIYGEMLFKNRHYEWARGLFQKNLTRWTKWTPRTPDTLRRLNLARAAVAECDRHIGE